MFKWFYLYTYLSGHVVFIILLLQNIVSSDIITALITKPAGFITPYDLTIR